VLEQQLAASELRPNFRRVRTSTTQRHVFPPVAARGEQLQSAELLFRVGDRFLRLSTDRPEIQGYLKRAYARLLAADSGERAGPVDSGRICWVDAKSTLTFDGAVLPQMDAPGGPLEAAVRGAATLFGMSFRRMRTARAVYAAGVARGSNALAILAPSGAGKTTLLLEMVRRGWQAFGDEFILLERQSLVAQPFALGLAIRESALRSCTDPRVARACADALVTSEPDGARTFHGIDVADVFGSGALAEARPLTHVVLFEREAANGPVLEPIAPAVAALRILPHFFIDDLAMPDVWETIDAVARFACYRLRAPDVGAAANLLDMLPTG